MMARGERGGSPRFFFFDYLQQLNAFLADPDRLKRPQKAKSKRKKNPLTVSVPVSQNIAILWS
jgi:hypothetical protein